MGSKDQTSFFKKYKLEIIVSLGLVILVAACGTEIKILLEEIQTF